MSDNGTEYMSIADVAAACGASDRTIRRWVATGRLAAVRFGGLVRIRRTDLDAFAEAKAVRSVR